MHPDKAPARKRFIAIRVLSQWVLQFVSEMILEHNGGIKFVCFGVLMRTHRIKSSPHLSVVLGYTWSVTED